MDLGKVDKNNRLLQKWYARSLKVLQKRANGRKPVFLFLSNDCLLIILQNRFLLRPG
jgi:hypothetical protein